MAELALQVNGRKYGGWKSLTVIRSIESLAGSFSVMATNRWGEQIIPWDVREEDAVIVTIDEQPVLDGWIDRREPIISAQDRSVSFEGKDRAAAIVENSVRLSSWTLRDIDILALARRLVARHKITISLQDGLALEKRRKVSWAPGDTIWDVLRREASLAEVLLVSDDAGGVVITRSGADRSTPLTLGENILNIRAEYMAGNRYAEYEVITQSPGDDGETGAINSRATATDKGVRRTDRLQVVRPVDGITTRSARAHADWIARTRAAQAEAVTVSVHGWLQPNGKLWPLNALCHVRAPDIDIDGDRLISEVRHTLSDAGEITVMRLVRPDAFTPEPRAVVRRQE